MFMHFMMCSNNISIFLYYMLIYKVKGPGEFERMFPEHLGHKSKVTPYHLYVYVVSNDLFYPGT